MDRQGTMGVRLRLVERATGGWLAVSESGSRLRIGVVGATAEDARARFERALAAWERLFEERGRGNGG